MLEFLSNLLDIYLDTAVWLLVGLLLAALIKGWIPDTLVRRWLDGEGAGPVLRASLIGAPLPLCSCGVLPAAIGLRRAGASKPATAAFLIATPETGVDSISVTYALMGPVMALIRPIAAVLSAIFSGLLVLLFDKPVPAPGKAESGGERPNAAAASCCGGHAVETSTAPVKHAQDANRCSDDCSHDAKRPGLSGGLRFAVAEVLDDIKVWLAFGLVLAALVATLIEPGKLSEYGSGLGAMLLMLLAGLPLYICATASTPLAAALLLAGVSPGAVLVFMLVGPATNIASIGILSKELGGRAVALYLLGISLSAIGLGLLLDTLLGASAITLPLGANQAQGTAFSLLQWLAGGLLLMLASKSLRGRLGF